MTGYSGNSVAPIGQVKANFSVNGSFYRDLPGDEFQVRTLGGSIYRVLTLKTPAGLNRGDLIGIIGQRDKGVIVATDVMITEQRETLTKAPAYRPHRMITGTVAADLKGNIFELRTASQTDRVLALCGEKPGGRAGAKVRIWAFWDAEQGLWQASNLRVLKR